MINAHHEAEHTDRSFPFNLSAISILGFCRAIDAGHAPAADPDMFTRWIRLSDDLLAANWKRGKKVGKRNRGKSGFVFRANHA